MPRLLVIDDRDHTIEMCHRNLGQFDYVTTELLRVGYRGERTLAAHDRLYPQVRQLIRELLEELRCELAELDPRLALTSIND